MAKRTDARIASGNMKKKKSASREVAEVVAAFVIAWLAYQGLAVLTGTPLPIVSVVSDSMYHTDHFDGWWTQSGGFYKSIDINKAEFRGMPTANGLSRGDLLFVVRPDNLKVGDVIIYNRLDGFTIVHRLIEINGNYVVTKGDNNADQDKTINVSQIQGKMVFAMPVLGYPRFLLHLVGI